MKFDEGRLVVTIELGNEAMSQPAMAAGLLIEIAGELNKLSDHQLSPGDYDGGAVRRKFRDINGNTVGFWKHEK